jgi:hypothetical protein
VIPVDVPALNLSLPRRMFLVLEDNMPLLALLLWVLLPAVLLPWVLLPLVLLLGMKRDLLRKRLLTSDDDVAGLLVVVAAALSEELLLLSDTDLKVQDIAHERRQSTTAEIQRIKQLYTTVVYVLVSSR